MNFDSTEKAWQSLADIEIEDDEKEYPAAVIRLRGSFLGINHSFFAKIVQCSEWDFAVYLIPWRTKIFNYYVNVLYASEKDSEKLQAKVRAMFDMISSVKSQKEIEEKRDEIIGLFSDIKITIDFYKLLKKIKVLPWYMSAKTCVKLFRPVDTLTLFAWLWLFNFDGVKKNCIYLLNSIVSDTNIQLPIVGTLSGKKITTGWDKVKENLKTQYIKSISKG